MLALVILPPSEEGGGPALDAGGGREKTTCLAVRVTSHIFIPKFQSQLYLH